MRPKKTSTVSPALWEDTTLTASARFNRSIAWTKYEKRKIHGLKHLQNIEQLHGDGVLHLLVAKQNSTREVRVGNIFTIMLNALVTLVNHKENCTLNGVLVLL